ncbi:MAG: hypothetical protein RR101_01365 [Burkholderiaceae bacterium]
MIKPSMAIRAALGLAIVAALAACDRTPTLYQPGQYKGAPVVAPQDSPRFGGDKAKLDAALNTRTELQNEYSRTEKK